MFGLQKNTKTLYYFKTAEDLKEYVKSQKKTYKGSIDLKVGCKLCLCFFEPHSIIALHANAVLCCD